MTTNETYHLIRLTAPAISVRASPSTIAVQTDGRIHFHNPETLEEIFAVQCMSLPPNLPVLAVGDRWAAYNLAPQQRSTSSALGMWNTLTSIGQDAFDNIVTAVSATATPHEVASPKGPLKNVRNGMIAIRDVVSMKVIACIEDKECNRPVEYLQFSPCGTKLVVTSGNGHSGKIYSVVPGSSEMELTHNLSRGITPAVITSIAVSVDGLSTAICSAKGTIHLFNQAEKVKTISVSPAEHGVNPVVVFDQDDYLLALNRATMTVLKFLGGELVETYTVVRELEGEDVVLTIPPSPPVRSSSAVSIELKTCREMPVPFWQSPMLVFGDSKPQFDKRFLQAIHRETVEEVDEDRYLKETSKDGFIQIVPNE